jgi:hypothetical protein
MRKDAPTGAWLRSSRSQRLVGPGAVCVSCGKESRPYGLIFGRELPCCYRCERIAQGRPPYELNHVFGRRNSDLTIRYPVNDHRAVLSVAQYRWPPGALENPNGSVLLASIAESHGLYDNTEHMLAEHKANSARLLHVEELLVTVYGLDWLPKLEAAAKRASRKAATKRKPHD